MKNKKISIIVAAYNVAEWLPRCIESIIAQTHTNWELFLINDGSTDCTSEVIDSLVKLDNRIIAVHQDNMGLVEVREKGISLATGEYVGFVDGDDAIDSNMYERLLYNMLTFDADISHCGLRVCYNGKVDMQSNCTEKLLIQNSIEALGDLLSGEWMVPSLCNKLYKRELLLDSCLDKRITNNEDLLRNFIVFSRAKKIVFQDFCGYQYWTRENSLSNDSKLVSRVKDVVDARKCILDNSVGKVKQYALSSWLSSIVNAVNSLIFSTDLESKNLCQQYRKLLIKEKKNIKFLIKRQQVAVVLIIICPLVYRYIYYVYNKWKGVRL